ncbi:hypothetical protein HB912_12355 [Listeria aquatica]|uniref:Uncharacterized protein n=1 Tax=Listeria aquatica TaxID=1494960 RepID=A0A841ZU55_9LIST|nr:hypothetical protein [Listeria aquatica]MBC1522440.1 hypothetical protein [Listeria aquatica]
MERETKRALYLEKFKRENEMVKGLFGREVDQIGTDLVELLKKEDLTLDQAYASLQYAYNLIKYESNFLRLK